MTTQLKHTPGPWRLDHDPSRTIIAGENHIITTILHPKDFDKSSIDEAKADARLISAAPDLLEATKDALDSILSFYKSNPKEAGEYFGAALCERLKESIAKAEGVQS